MTDKHQPLAGYWNGIHDALKGRLDSVREYLKHPASGINAENYFRDLLRDYLPQRFAVESGFVVNAKGDRSDFMDVLIVDCMNIAPLSAEPHFKVFPSEAVVGAVEITSAPKSKVRRAGVNGKISKLQDDLMKMGRLRDLAKEREYIHTIPVPVFKDKVTYSQGTSSYKLAPRSFLITFGDEWKNPETYEKNLLSAMTSAQKIQPHSWVNAAFSMRHGMFHFLPHKPDNAHKRIPIGQNALLEFMMFVARAVGDFPTSRIDLTRYRPNLPTAADEANAPEQKAAKKKGG